MFFLWQSRFVFTSTYFVSFFVCQCCDLFAILIRANLLKIKSYTNYHQILNYMFWMFFLFDLFNKFFEVQYKFQFNFFWPSYRTVFIYVMWNEVSWVVLCLYSARYYETPNPHKTKSHQILCITQSKTICKAHTMYNNTSLFELESVQIQKNTGVFVNAQ